MPCILVATDGSESATRAVAYAARLAKSEKADLVVVNVIGQSIPEKIFERFTHAQQVWVKELLEAESAEILAKARDLARSAGRRTVAVESRSGNVARTVLEIAREKAVEAIVVGKRGTGQLSGLLLGSVSQKLVSVAAYPVTVVP